MSESRGNRFRAGSDAETRRRAHDMLARGYFDNKGEVTLIGADTVVEHDTCHDEAAIILSPLNSQAAGLSPWISRAKKSFTIHGGSSGAKFMFTVTA